METTAKLDKLRLLIVEDNPHMMLIVKTIFRGFGIKELIEARNSSEAWERLNTHAIDIVVMDRVLGHEDALALVERIRTDQSSPNAYVPIVMLSAHAERSKVEEARDTGINEFCCKPVTAKDLFTKVAAVIDHPRPYVRTSEFFGPDRRRQVKESYGGEERRQDGETASAA